VPVRWGRERKRDGRANMMIAAGKEMAEFVGEKNGKHSWKEQMAGCGEREVP